MCEKENQELKWKKFENFLKRNPEKCMEAEG